MQQHRYRHVVGQVGHQGGRRARPRSVVVGQACSRQFDDVQGVGDDEVEPVSSLGHALTDGSRQLLGEQLVDLDRHHGRPRLQQAEGEGSQPGADLNDSIVRIDSGQRDDTAHGVGVVDEVLTPGLGGAQSDLVGDGAQRGGVEQPAHRVSSPLAGNCRGVTPCTSSQGPP